MNNKHWLVLTLVGALASLDAAAGPADRSGQEVVAAVCAECHASGKNGAPRIGDMADWISRLTGGIAEVTRHAITGFRKMPAHGGDAALSDLEVSRAVAFMINPSAGSAGQTNKPFSTPLARKGEDIYNARCYECHASGKQGAPKIGDARDWIARMQKGIDALTQNAIRGHNSMPARGGMASLSDPEMRAAALYMGTSAIGTALRTAHAPEKP